MKPNEPLPDNALDAWLDERRHAAAPDGFSDRVLERIASEQSAREKSRWRSPAIWARAAILTLAVAGGLGRYMLLLVCLITG